MADLVETTYSVGGGAAATIDIGSPAENDLILIVAAIFAAATMATPAGYTRLFVSTNTTSLYCWYKIAGTSEVDPTATPSFSASTAFCVQIIRGVDTAAPFGSVGVGYATSTFTNVKEVAAPTLTTGASATKNLVLHVGAITTDRIIPDFSKVSAVNIAYSSGGLFVAKEWIENASTASSTFNWLTSQSSSRTGNLAVIAINNKTDGLRDIGCTMTHTRLAKPYPYGNNDTLSAPNTILTGATPLDGLIAASAAAGLLTTSSLGASYVTSLNIATNTNFGADTWAGFSWPTPSASMDLTGKIIGLAFRPGSPWSTVTADTRGIALCLSDSAGNVAAYRLRTLFTAYVDTDHICFISPGVTTPYGTIGTLDLTDISNITFVYARQSGQTQQPAVNLSNIYVFDGTSVLVGGSTRKPINASQIYKHLTQYLDVTGTVGLYNFAAALGSGQCLGYAPVQLGNGIIPTYVDLSANSFETPLATTRLNDYNVVDGIYGIVLYGSSTCTFDLRSAIIQSHDLLSFTLHASSSLSASLLTNNASFIGRTFSDLAGYTWTSVAWSKCATVAFKNSTLTNCLISLPDDSISGTTGAVCSFSANGALIEGTTISCTKVSGGATGYFIKLGSAVTAIEINNTTLSGVPGTDKFYSELTSGELVITTDGTGTALVAGDVTFIGGSTAFATIAAPTTNQSVVLTGLSTTCRVQLYDTTASTELYNAEPGATSYTWTDPSVAVANRPIRLRITDYLGATAKVMVERNIGTCGTTEGTASISFNNEFQEDTNYNEQAAALGYNGADITDIAIVDATNHVNFNFLSGGDYDARRIYMYMVYWLDTEAGIRDDFVFCAPLDPVNLPMTGVLFENVTSPQEIITFVNAYVYDSTTGRAKDLIVGDGINFAPDHVVQVIATVGGVNIITGDEQNILDAIAAIPADVNSDSRTLTVSKLLALQQEQE